VPAGIFLPTIAIGACLGRAVGLIMFVLSITLNGLRDNHSTLGRSYTVHIRMLGHLIVVPLILQWAVYLLVFMQ
jgi:hypothetical protein